MSLVTSVMAENLLLKHGGHNLALPSLWPATLLVTCHCCRQLLPASLGVFLQTVLWVFLSFRSELARSKRQAGLGPVRTTTFLTSSGCVLGPVAGLGPH